MKIAIGTREEIIAEAESWIPTPYLKQSHGQVKHAGANCATFIFATFQACGFINDGEDVGVFASDWDCHKSEEIYMQRILRHTVKLIEARSQISLKTEPGNIALVKTPEARVFNHGGIVIQWPTVIHCAPDFGVEKINASAHWLWASRELCLFDPWGKLHGIS